MATYQEENQLWQDTGREAVMARKREIGSHTPALNKFIDPEKWLKKCVLRFFICHLDKNFLTFWANSVGNPQRKQ